MNKLFAVLSVCVTGLFMAINAQAQTTTIIGTGENTTVVPTNTDWNLSKVFSGQGWQQGAKDFISFAEGTTNHGLIQIEAGALVGESSHDVGGFVSAYLPINSTNSLFGAGFGVAYLNHNFYDATLNARLGDTFALPIVRWPVYAYIESGGGYNISRSEAVAQAFAGVSLPIPITQSSTLTLGAAVGRISDVAENVLALGGSWTWKF